MASRIVRSPITSLAFLLLAAVACQSDALPFGADSGIANEGRAPGTTASMTVPGSSPGAMVPGNVPMQQEPLVTGRGGATGAGAAPGRPSMGEGGAGMGGSKGPMGGASGSGGNLVGTGGTMSGGSGGATGIGGSKPDAGPLMCGPVCAIFCPNGNVTDARGCPTCQCKPDPKTCPAVMCKLGCPNGFARDATGCEICKCAELACDSYKEAGPCAKDLNCTWVQYGCPAPGLKSPIQQCISRTLLCDKPTMCPAGKSCVQTNVAASDSTEPVGKFVPGQPRPDIACRVSAFPICM